jgi:hypothetical protein
MKRAPDGFDIDQPGKVSHRRREAGCRSDSNIVAVVTDDSVDCAVPCFRPDDVDGLCRFLVGRLGLAGHTRS